VISFWFHQKYDSAQCVQQEISLVWPDGTYNCRIKCMLCHMTW